MSELHSLGQNIILTNKIRMTFEKLLFNIPDIKNIYSISNCFLI